MSQRRRKRAEVTRGPFDPGGQPDTRIGQPLELGFFAWNVTAGMTASTAVLDDPPRLQNYWQWQHARPLIELAEHVGFDYQVPFARWIGQGGETDFNGSSLDFLASAAATAPITNRMGLFSTVHVTYRFHPLHIAKFGATIDHISNGRWGLNIVSGYSAREMAAFGFKEPIDHDVAYEMADEFTCLMKYLWTEEEPFDFEGDYYRAYGAYISPRSARTPRPILMNAGGSATGLDFAVRNVDWVFTVPHTTTYRDAVDDIHARAASYGREVRVATMIWFLADATDELARARYDDIRARIDFRATLNFFRSITRSRDFEHLTDELDDEDPYGGVEPDLFSSMALGFTSPQIVGSYDSVAEQLRDLSEQGVESILVCFVDPQQGLHQMQDEVIPILKRMGLRT